MKVVKVELTENEFDSLMYCTNGQNSVLASEFLPMYQEFLGDDAKGINYEDLLLFQKM